MTITQYVLDKNIYKSKNINLLIFIETPSHGYKIADNDKHYDKP